MRPRRRITGSAAALTAAVFAVAAALWGCRSMIPRIDPAEPAFHGRSVEELRELDLGRSDYLAKCSGCHALYAPARGDRSYWDHWVGAMAERSKLTDSDRRLIEGYLFAVCRGTGFEASPGFPAADPKPGGSFTRR